MVKISNNRRLVKWVGDPRISLSDNRTIADWDWEDNRVVAVVGRAVRVCLQDEFPGLSRAVVFGGTVKGKTAKEMRENSIPSTDPRTFIQEVDEVDADILLKHGVWEFVDVTDAEDPLLVVNEPIFIHQSKSSGELFRSR